MTTQDEEGHDGRMSVRDMQDWLFEEARDSAKAHELRIKDASALVEAYVAGKLTPLEMEERMFQYDQRWGEALPGAVAAPGISDEDILRAIDQSHEVHKNRIATVTRQRLNTRPR